MRSSSCLLSVQTFILFPYVSPWVQGLPVSGWCPAFYVTLWILHVSHAFQGSAELNLLPFVVCSKGFRLKDLRSNHFIPFTKGFWMDFCIGVMADGFKKPVTGGWQSFCWINECAKNVGLQQVPAVRKYELLTCDGDSDTAFRQMWTVPYDWRLGSSGKLLLLIAM